MSLAWPANVRPAPDPRPVFVGLRRMLKIPRSRVINQILRRRRRIASRSYYPRLDKFAHYRLIGFG